MTANKKYDPAAEMAKGARLTALSFDKLQKVSVTGPLVTVGGQPGSVEFSGKARGRGAGIDGTMSVWLSIFRYNRPDGTVNHVAGWNVTLPLKPGQKPEVTAKDFEKFINSAARPYRAKAVRTALSITYDEKD
ncbi:MAG TPA: hypothetical protein PK523_05090 [Elusimicrobiales bacterium]|nr:hypothetical protein [Elusimicrobiales bacterium]